MAPGADPIKPFLSRFTHSLYQAGPFQSILKYLYA